MRCYCYNRQWIANFNSVDNSLVDNAIAARDLISLARDFFLGCKQTQEDE